MTHFRSMMEREERTDPCIPLSEPEAIFQRFVGHTDPSTFGGLSVDALSRDEATVRAPHPGTYTRDASERAVTEAGAPDVDSLSSMNFHDSKNLNESSAGQEAPRPNAYRPSHTLLRDDTGPAEAAGGGGIEVDASLNHPMRGPLPTPQPASLPDANYDAPLSLRQVRLWSEHRQQVVCRPSITDRDFESEDEDRFEDYDLSRSDLSRPLSSAENAMDEKSFTSDDEHEGIVLLTKVKRSSQPPPPSDPARLVKDWELEGSVVRSRDALRDSEEAMRLVPGAETLRDSLESSPHEKIEDGQIPSRELERTLSDMSVLYRYGHQQQVAATLSALRAEFPRDLLLIRQISEFYLELGDKMAAIDAYFALASGLFERGNLTGMGRALDQILCLDAHNPRAHRLRELLEARPKQDLVD